MKKKPKYIHIALKSYYGCHSL